MKITLFKDTTVPLNLESIVANFNRLTNPTFALRVGQAPVNIPGNVVSFPKTYSQLDRAIDKEISDEDLGILFTGHPYDNNYYFEADGGKKVIVSLSGWEWLSPLP